MLAKWLILLISVFLLFYNLGSNHLSNWDEAWYADMTRTMIETGNFLTPIWNTRPYLEKPPLYYWASAITMNVFGINELSARLPSAIAGVGVVYLVYLLAKLLFQKEKIALISALIIISTIGFLYRTRTGNMDTFLTFWIVLSIYGYFRMITRQQDSRNFPGIFSLGIIGAFLTKGLMAFVFPGVVMIWALINPKLKLLPKQFFWGIGLALAICLVWLGLNVVANGQIFLNYFFGHQAEKTFSRWQFWQAFSWDYLNYLRSGLKLWFIVAIPSVLYSLWQLRRETAYLIVIYLTAVLVGLSFFSNKSDWFLLPLYPLIAVVTSYALWAMSDGLSKKIPKFLLTLTVVAIAGWQLYHYRSQYLTPDIAGDEARVALAAKQLTRPKDVLYLTHYYFPTTVYYSQRKVLAVYSEKEQNESWWILPKSRWNQIVQGSPVYVITTTEDWNFMRDILPKEKFQVLYQSGEKLLLGKL